MDIVVGNGHGNTSSNPEQDCLHFIPLGKVCILLISPEVPVV